MTPENHEKTIELMTLGFEQMKQEMNRLSKENNRLEGLLRKHELKNREQVAFDAVGIPIYSGDAIHWTRKGTGSYYSAPRLGVMIRADVFDKETIYFINEKDAIKFVEEKNRKPLMTSEDGVELFIGDTFYWTCPLPIIAESSREKWTEPTQSFFKDNFFDSTNKYFSDKEAAEKWVENQNKPRSIKIDFNTDRNKHAIVDEFGIQLYAGGQLRYNIYPNEKDRILEAIEKLKSQ